MELLQSTDFWLGLLLIIWINIILSGDNAVVIALAARSLPPGILANRWRYLAALDWRATA
jgi:predicted tellurium resistance membrane protein TerC